MALEREWGNVVKRCLLALALAAGVSAAAAASAEDDAVVTGARDFVTDIGDRTVAVLTATSISGEELKVSLGKLLIEGVDFELLGRFALGRQGRRAKGGLFDEYVQLFTAHIIDLAAERFAELGVQSYSITKARRMPDGDVIVSTDIHRTAGDPFEAGWRVRLRDERYRINDMLVEGYSVGIHFRNSFERLIDGGLDGIVRKLRSQTSGSAALTLAKQYKVSN